MNRCLRLACLAAATTMFAVNVQATDIFWSGGTGNLTDANYSDGVNTGLTPQELDLIFLGNSGTITHSVTGIALHQKLRVGHDSSPPGGVGSATLTVNNGAQLSLTSAGGGAAASVIIGGGAVATTNSGYDGTLNIDGTDSKVTSAQLVQIGFGSKSTANATVNITNGGSLVASSGNINLGERNGNTGTGVPGHLDISGATSSLTITNATADLNIGVRATSTFMQSDGTVSVGDQVTVGQNPHNSSFSMTGGSHTNGGITVGQNSVQNASFSITGGTFTTKTSGVMLVGTNSSQNASLTVGGNAILNLGSNITIGDTTASGANLTVSGTADINIPGTASAGNIFVGRGTSSGAKFTMTGGTIDLGNHFLMGTATTPGATGIVGTHSGGTITTTNNFVLADSFGASTYNLSGTGAINASGLVIVGRQSAAGVMNQTGGTVTATLGVNVGNAQNATTTLWGTGTYNVSGGTLTANQTTGTALSIAPQGTGTFRVIGDDTTLIDVNGNMTVNAGGGAQGTLAFQLETGDLLSLIDVRDVATFSAGSILWFDTSLAAPTQATYNLLTATSIVDNGITKNFPAGWDYHIITGGNGQILQAFQPPVGLLGDFNNDTKVDAGDYVTWRKNEVANAALPNDNAVGNQADRYTLWQTNFGNPPGSGTGLSGAQVPEPTTLGLLVLGLSSVITIRRRNRINTCS